MLITFSLAYRNPGRLCGTRVATCFRGAGGIVARLGKRFSGERQALLPCVAVCCAGCGVAQMEELVKGAALLRHGVGVYQRSESGRCALYWAGSQPHLSAHVLLNPGGVQSDKSSLEYSRQQAIEATGRHAGGPESLCNSHGQCARLGLDGGDRVFFLLLCKSRAGRGKRTG